MTWSHHNQKENTIRYLIAVLLAVALIGQTSAAQSPPALKTEPVHKVATVVTPAAPPPEAAPAAAPEPVQPALPSGSHEDWMTQAGISQNDWPAVDYIISHESGWNYTAVNSEGATGLCQALPGSKMASIAPDYLTSPVTQLKWCSSYATSRYGGWWASYNAWVAQHWW